MKELMEYKAAKKRRNPNFMRQEFNKRIRLSRSSWRKPKGVDSKMREQRGGHRPIVKIGYGTPRILRGRLSSGLIEKRINTIEDFKNLAKDEIALIPRTIGNRLRLILLKEASKSKIPISNFRDVDAKIKEIESEFKSRKEKRTTLKLKKTNKIKESKPKEDKKSEKPKSDKKSEKPKSEKPKSEKPKSDKKSEKPKSEKPKSEKPKSEKKESKPKESKK